MPLAHGFGLHKKLHIGSRIWFAAWYWLSDLSYILAPGFDLRLDIGSRIWVTYWLSDWFAACYWLMGLSYSLLLALGFGLLLAIGSRIWVEACYWLSDLSNILLLALGCKLQLTFDTWIWVTAGFLQTLWFELKLRTSRAESQLKPFKLLIRQTRSNVLITEGITFTYEKNSFFKP